VAVQYAGLPAKCFDNARVTMADVRYVVIGVQVPLAVGVPDPDTFAPHELQRLLVEERRVAPQYVEASLEK
jgi:hypothetical protein